ncbi:MAG: hypothetical protein FWC17_04930 [Treponema sp.]|nr:hypothetical protein [Treponema sp.]
MANLCVFQRNSQRKILTAVLILGFFAIIPAAAQDETEISAAVEWTKEDLQSIYMEYLRQEGYMPLVDVDGDIQFKVSGANYFIIVDDRDLMFFQIYMGFSLGIVSREDALNAANDANRLSKVAKISISSDDSLRIIVSITAELLLENPVEFIPVFSRALSLIRNAENNFIRQFPAEI